MKRFSLILPLLSVIIMLSCESKNPKENKSLKQEVHSLLSAKNESGEFNGVALVAHRDSVYSYAFGWANLSDSSKLSFDHAFYLGSLAKQFTGMGIMLLAEEGKLSLDEPVANYFDSLPSFCNSITIRNMLNHTSGLPDYYGMGIFEPGMTNAMVLKAMYGLDSLDFEPGSAYSYSNSAYVMLSVIIERASGMGFSNFMASRVFEPLSMNSTVAYDITKPELPLRALGHTAEGQRDDYDAYTTGGGGIFSNVSDLYTWVKGLDAFKLIEKERLREAYQPAVLSNGNLSFYGFGWRLDEDHPELVQHSGSLAGFRTYLFRNMESGTVIILLSNFTNNVSEINAEIRKLLDE